VAETARRLAISTHYVKKLLHRLHDRSVFAIMVQIIAGCFAPAFLYDLPGRRNVAAR
jgi:hypothetical protein